jgi:hypothetical protein
MAEPSMVDCCSGADAKGGALGARGAPHTECADHFALGRAGRGASLPGLRQRLGNPRQPPSTPVNPRQPPSTHRQPTVNFRQLRRSVRRAAGVMVGVAVPGGEEAEAVHAVGKEPGTRRGVRRGAEVDVVAVLLPAGFLPLDDDEVRPVRVHPQGAQALDARCPVGRRDLVPGLFGVRQQRLIVGLLSLPGIALEPLVIQRARRGDALHATAEQEDKRPEDDRDEAVECKGGRWVRVHPRKVSGVGGGGSEKWGGRKRKGRKGKVKRAEGDRLDPSALRLAPPRFVVRTATLRAFQDKGSG